MMDLKGDSLTEGRFLRPDVKRHLETDYLPRYLLGRRWFAGKGGLLPVVTITDVIPTDAASGPILLFVEVAARKPQTYLLPVGITSGPVAADAYICEVQLLGNHGYLVDALDDTRLLVGLLTALEKATENGRLAELDLRFAREPGFPSQVNIDTVGRLGAEQSNSSIRIGNALLKAFRKLESGIHPELEMARFLTGPGRFANAPDLLGSLERLYPHPTTLFIFQRIIENEGNAWEVVCHLLGQVDNACENYPWLRALAALLGTRTASLHNTLASGATPEYSSEPIVNDDVATWVDDVCHNATSSLETLAGHPSSACQRLVARKDELFATIRSLAPRRVDSRKSRLHGDLHLGQVLVTTDDVFIIDFEGEPLRTFAERRAKYPPMKDVAGILRSFDYALATMEGKGLPRRPISGYAPFIQQAKRTFLKNYRASAQGFPNSLAEAESLLRLFLFEKTFYEIRYEIANRPDWIEIPVVGALALLDSNFDQFASDE